MQVSRPHLQHLVSLRRPTSEPARGRIALELGLRIGGVALLAAIGAIHLHLWLAGYSQLPTNGPLFLLDAISAFALAASLLVTVRPLLALLGAGLSAATLGALIVSVNFGLFGFKESIGASFVEVSIVIETVAAVILLSLASLASERLETRRRP